MENFSAYFAWSETDRLFHLGNSLNKNAGQVLWDCGPLESTNALIAVLRSRYGSGNQSERYRLELKNRRRKPGESLQTLHEDIKRLLAMAHDGATGKIIESLGIDSFADALNNKDHRRLILQKSCKTLDEALLVALRLEAIDCTAQPELTHIYNADGQRLDKTHVRGVSVDDKQSNDSGLSLLDFEYWKAQQLLNLKRVSDANSFYGSTMSGITSVSGPSTSFTYQPIQGVQQPPQVPTYQPVRNTLFAPMQTPQVPIGMNPQPYLQQNFRPRAPRIRIPRHLQTCFICKQHGHFKRDCPYRPPDIPQSYTNPLLYPPDYQYQASNYSVPVAYPTRYPTSYLPSNTTYLNNKHPVLQTPYVNNIGQTIQSLTPNGNISSFPVVQQSQSSMPLDTNRSFQTTPEYPSNAYSSQAHAQSSVTTSIQNEPSLDSSETESTSKYHAKGVTIQKTSPSTYIEIMLNGSKHRCLLDTGCDFSLIPKKLIPTAILNPIALDVYAANGSPIKILGVTNCNFHIAGMPVSASLLVSEDIEEFMLGYDWLNLQQIIWNFDAKQIIFRGKPS